MSGDAGPARVTVGQLVSDPTRTRADVLQALGRGRLVEELLGPLELITAGGEMIGCSAGGEWRSLARGSGAAPSLALVLFSDGDGRSPQREVLEAFRNFGEGNVWFLEYRGRYAPYRMTERDYRRLCALLRWQPALAFPGRVLRRLVSFAAARGAAPATLERARELFLTADGDLRAELGASFREYYTGFGAVERVAPDFFVGCFNTVALAERALGEPIRGRVAEIGCGHGVQACAFALADAGSEVIAIDNDAGCIESVRALRSLLPNLVPLQADCEATGLDGSSVDVVFSSDAVQHFPHVGRMLAEALRVLKPGGRLIVDEVNRDAIPIRPLVRPEHPFRRAPTALFDWQRRELIRGLLPDAPGEHIAALAAQSCGLEHNEIAGWVAGGMRQAALVELREVRLRDGEYFEQRAPSGWCEERFFSAPDLERRTRAAGFERPRTYFHSFGRVPMPRALRAYAHRILVIADKRQE